MPEASNDPLADCAGEFEEMALSDEDFDAPVYRSLGGATMFSGASMFNGAHGDELVDEDFDLPVYRSLGDFADVAAEAEAPQCSLPQQAAIDNERAWLQTMPPLV